MSDITSGKRSKDGFFLVKSLTGGPPTIKNFPLTATAFYEGNVVRVSGTSGSAAPMASRGTSPVGVILCTVAAADASTGVYPVALATQDNVFKASMPFASYAQKVMLDDYPITASNKAYTICGTASATAAHNLVSIVGWDDFKADNATAVSGGASGTATWFHCVFTRTNLGQTKADAGT